MKNMIGVLALALLACSGSEASLGDGGSDSGNNVSDSGNNTNDSGGGNDSGMMVSDSGMGMDTGPADDATANDGSTEGGMMGFNPGNLSCLVLWLDAAKGITQVNNAVSKWDDQSGKGNHASQGIAQRQPTLMNSVINNLPALHFSQGTNQQGSVGNMLVINDSMTMQWGTGDFGVWVVARFNNLTNAGFPLSTALFFSKAGQSNNGAGPFLQGNFFSGNGATAGAAGAIDQNNFITQGANYNDNTARSYGWRRVGNTLELRVNGQAIATKQQANMVDVSAPQVNARIGADGDASYRRLNGDIAEVVACKGPISMQDLSSLDAYFKSKYNL